MFIVGVTPTEGALTEWKIASTPMEGSESGDPMPWSFRIDGGVPTDDVERSYDFYCGEVRKFSFTGPFAVACVLVGSLGRGAELTRCAMRFALLVPAVAEVYGDPARAEIETAKAFSFMRWLGALGTTLLTAGLRPWMGTVGESEILKAPGSFAVPESTEIN